MPAALVHPAGDALVPGVQQSTASAVSRSGDSTKEHTHCFIQMQEADETLSDTSRRTSYDRALACGVCRLAFSRPQDATTPPPSTTRSGNEVLLNLRSDESRKWKSCTFPGGVEDVCRPDPLAT